ncbi:MAG: hypothetical protein KBD78_04785 [Oligoflexales bacterium]|nr:hypothetical protein [Oligoflexales bacterium]
MRHLISPSQSAYYLQTQGVCSALYTLETRIVCLSENYSIVESGSVGLSLDVKANEEEYRLLERFFSKEVTAEDLSSLFSENSFLHAAGQTTIRTIYKKTEVAYVPIFFAGGLKVSNPVLPTLRLSAIKGSQFRFSHYFLFSDWPGSKYGEIIVSPRVWVYNQVRMKGDVDLISSPQTKLSQQIVKDETRGVDGSLSATLTSRSEFYPSLSVKVENLAQDSECIECENRELDVERYFNQLSQVAVSSFIRHYYGRSIFGFSLPFWGLYQDLDRQAVAASYVYRIANLNTLASYSISKTSFGFILDTDNYSLGIQYTDEKQANYFKVSRMRQTYVSASYNF